MALVFILRTAGLFAADEQKEMPESRDTVIIPYDPKKPVKDQHPDKVYLRYDRFLELWEAAKRSRTPDRERPAAVAFALAAARYEGRVEEKRVAFTVTLDFSTFDEQWVRVPVPFERVQISELAVDGKPAAFADSALVVEKPGRHSLTASFEIPLAPGAREFAWGIPRSAATRLVLTLPETRWSARIQPDAGVIERIVDGKKTVTAALGSATKISVVLVEAESAARLVEPATADVETSVTVLPGYERFDVAANFAFAGAQQDRFTVSFEKGITVAELDAPGMKSWKLTDAGERQTLEVLLSQPAKESFRLTLVAEHPQADALPADRTAPQFSPGARRVNRTTLLFAGDGIALTPAPGDGLRQVEVAHKAEGEARPVGAWAGDAKLAYRTSLAAAKHEARVDYVYQVNRRKIELIASLQLHAKDAPLFDVTLTLPAGFDVQAVDSARLQDWWRDGAKLHVRFKGGTPPVTPLVVYLVREYAAAPQQLDVQPLALDGFSKVTGEAVIAAHKGVSATLQLAGDAGPDAAKEVDPAKAATDFQILPPLERKRGFTFSNQNFSGEVTLAPLPVKENVTWMMHAEAHEAWLSLSMKAQLSLRQGSIGRTSFSLPAALPEAHVTGAEVRETRSKVEGARRIYEVAFQNDVYDTVDFTVDVDLTMAEGKKPDARKVNEITLPAPEFPETLITTGYVIADNASEYELKLETEGVEKAQPSVIPWLPSVTKSAGIFRVQPVWKVTLVMEWLEKVEARAAFCAWAEMTTALRDDGTEWYKAVWHLQNRSLQFLPVKLPDGAALMSARVAGQNVRADSGTVNGRAAVLIPLIKTRPGDISYDVEVVWKQSGAKLSPRDRRKFYEAELVGITVEQTFWSVWLPEDRTLTGSGGNMEEVLAVARDVEKARSGVEEMSALNSIIADPTVSEDARANAKRNWDMKCAEVQGILISNGGVLQSGRYSVAQEGIGKNKEQVELVKKLSDTNAYVGQQLAKVEEDNRKIVQQRVGQAGVAGGGRGSQGTTLDVNGLAQTTNNANAAQVLLFGNNTYSGATTINSGTLNVTNGGSAFAGAPAVNTATVGGVISNASSGANQMNVNGGVVQMDVGSLANLNSNVAAQNGQNARWNLNDAANVAAQTQPAPGPEGKPANTRNFYVNDNVVLQQAKAEDGTLKLAKSGAGTLSLKGPGGISVGGKISRERDGFTNLEEFKGATKKSDEFSHRDREDNAKAPAAKSESATMATREKDGDGKPDQARSLNYARGNRQQQMEQAQAFSNADMQQAARQPASQPMPQTALPRGGAASPAEQPQLRVLSPDARVSALSDGSSVTTGNRSGTLAISPNAIDSLLAGTSRPQNMPSQTQSPQGGVLPPMEAPATRNATGSAEQKAIQQLGRLSLAVDFPTQGHVHHFQKAKASAVLEVSFADPSIVRRWIRIAIFAGLAVLLWLAGWVVSSRRAERAA
ncbi:MAG: hypothetical protein ABI318_13195 [Chthoniobacteraceae bacterium]